jgi:hypothetical protein
MDFHNTGWDPYQALNKHEHLINQLINANNSSHAMLADLIEQHRQLVQMFAETQRELHKVKQQLDNSHISQ